MTLNFQNFRCPPKSTLEGLIYQFHNLIGQLLYKYNLGGGWFFNGNPTFSYNHNASSDDALTLPLAFGGSRTVIIAGRPWTFSAQYWYYIVSPDTFGPKHKIRIGISPVIDLPW